MSTLDVTMYAALLLVCGAALVKGRRPERLMALVLLAAFAVQAVPAWRALLTSEPIALYSAPATMAIDIVQLAAMLAVALTSRPGWTLFAAAFQLLAALVSFIRITDDRLGLVAYVTAQNTLWWLTLVALSFGVWQAWSAGRAGADGRRPPRARA